MFDGLKELDEFRDKSSDLTEMERIFYSLNEQGLTLKDLDELPLPYIFGLMRVHTEYKKKEADAYKKAKRKK